MAIFVQNTTMGERHNTGRDGEAKAKEHLIRKGYTILHTNWRSGHYELDIVAIHEDELVVIEVKTRSGNYLQEPARAVGERKIQRTVAAANAYVKYHQHDLPVRFDVITLVKKENEFVIDHIEDAFYPPLRHR